MLTQQVHCVNENPSWTGCLPEKSGGGRGRIIMFWSRRKDQVKQEDYDRENWRPVLKCSICNGEKVAGFKNIHTGEFKEECFIRDDRELEEFKQKYGIREMPKEY